MARRVTGARGKPWETKSPAPAVTRAAALLGLLAAPDAGTPTLSDLARRLGLPKTSVANLLTALEEAGLVHRTEGRYRLGHVILELGSAYLRGLPFLQEFMDACRRLPTASAETVLLGQLDNTDVLYLARHDGSQPIRLASDIGRRLPANCTALGKAMLASMASDDVIERYRRRSSLPALSPNSLRSIDALIGDLELTRRRGYAIDDEENTLGIMCVGVAIPRSGATGPLRAVSVTLLKARAEEGLRACLVRDLADLASHLALRSGE